MVQRILGVPFVPARLFPLVAAVAALLVAVPAGATVTDWVLARATERAAIARELPDLIAHHVASIVLRIGVACHVVPDTGGRMAEVLDDVYATGTPRWPTCANS